MKLSLFQFFVDPFSAVNNLYNWAKPERVSGDLVNKLSTCEIRKDPLGVVLIIGPWNYPIQTVLMPLIGAIAAGRDKSI